MVNITSTKLVRCELFNKNNVSSIRLVELSHFKLWEYMIQHKHGMEIRNKELCLWVSVDEFNNKKSLYSRAGKIEQVNRVDVTVFATESSHCHTTHRYVADSETEELQTILLSHIPVATKDSEDYGVDVCKGYMVSNLSSLKDEALMLGLNNN